MALLALSPPSPVGEGGRKQKVISTQVKVHTIAVNMRYLSIQLAGPDRPTDDKNKKATGHIILWLHGASEKDAARIALLCAHHRRDGGTLHAIARLFYGAKKPQALLYLWSKGQRAAARGRTARGALERDVRKRSWPVKGLRALVDGGYGSV